MLQHPNFDPVAIEIPAFEIFGLSLGPLQVHWYGLMYLFGFAAALLLGLYRAGQPHTPVKRNQIEDLIFYGAIGLVLGARMGYVFFYNFDAFLENPAWLLKVWEGGMSFHGGMLGIMVAMVVYSRKIKRNFVDVMDFVVPLAPIGLCFGRLGNFIGQELWGRETDVAWGMVFPKDDLGLVRHPSQLYQAFFEGLVLFIIVFWFSRKPRPRFAVSGLFLFFYGIFRFGVEFVREPDAHIGFIYGGWMTKGQLLSLPMIVCGAAMIVYAYRDKLPGKQRTAASSK